MSMAVDGRRYVEILVESPDYTGRGVRLLKADTADDIPREGKCNRKETAARYSPVRVKRRGKSPPGV